ncbi:MAG TPA: cell division protein FtsZ, partial [Candidatus Ozemobacteraceae bacterium]|nr:cell division protein FtsZ [Candidatus Ozemobacteraceae bacterium]
MGIGIAQGENRAVDAAQMAINSPLLESSIAGAKGVLINITAGPDLTLHEVNKACSIVEETVDQDATIIFGAVYDENLKGSLQIAVIATGFGEEARNAVDPKRKIIEDLRTIRTQEIAQPVAAAHSNVTPIAASLDDREIPAFLRRKRG